VHVAADGKRYALLHGDQYDQVTTCARWLSVLGDASYNMLVELNRSLSWARRKLKLGGHWSLADYASATSRERPASFPDSRWRSPATQKALAVDGVICGHIHTPVIKQVDGVVYLNCGDWWTVAPHRRAPGRQHGAGSPIRGEQRAGERSDELAEAA